MDVLGTKYTHRCLSLLALLLAAAWPLCAQAPYSSPGAAVTAVSASPDSDQSDNPVLTIRKRVDEVNLLFIAMDHHGKFVRDLNLDDFTILDDHKPPQAIVNFTRQTDLPLQLGLLVDTSGSVHSRFGFEQEAALSFLQHTLRPNFDQAFIMGFNSHSRVTQDFTDNLGLLTAGVNRLQNGGGTALYDAIYHACRDKLNREKTEQPVRHAIIVVSDGEDNQSEATLGQAIEMAQRGQVIIYAISTDDSGLILRGDKILAQLAAATGGRAFFPFKMKDITRAFGAIEDELRSQYVVSYRPADFDADGRYRAIQITSDRKDLTIRAREGYYAPRQ
ncbi:MAG TPA: VWA domain-containing protein [Terriglobales bacterium]|nr:VWA domain-containing protein [Terriglobales bacterium]